MNDTARLDYNPSITEQSRTLPDPKQQTLTDKIRLINKDKNLSKGSKTLGIEIIIASNWRGYCWHSIEAFSKLTASSESQVHCYLRQLQENGYIAVVNRPGRTNYYYLGKKFISTPSESPPRGVLKTTPKIEIKDKENVIGMTNVTLNFPDKENHPKVHSGSNTAEEFGDKMIAPAQETKDKNIIIQPDTGPEDQGHVIRKSSNLIDMTLVQEILEITGDKKSTACFIKIVKNVPKNIIFAAISSLKIAMEEDYILRPGGYFVSTIKNYCSDVFYSPKTYHDSPVTKNNSIVAPFKTPKKQCFEPEDKIVPATREIAMEAIKTIKMILDKPVTTP